MSKHTSGPWRVDKRPKSRAYISAEHCVVAQVFALIHQDANARLIAAAPDLLEALVELRKECSGVAPFANAVATQSSVKDIRRVGRFMAACERADAAIAKATGEDK